MSAIDFAGRCLEDLALQPLGKPEHVDCAMHRGFGRLHRVVLVVDRRSGTGEIVDLVDLDIERKRHIVAQEFEARIGVEMVDIALRAGEEIVEAQHFVAFGKQPVRQVRAEEAGATGDKDTLAAVHQSRHVIDLSLVVRLQARLPIRRAVPW
jgi:hypothetical protein